MPFKEIIHLSTRFQEIMPLSSKKIMARFNGPKVLANSLPKSGTNLLIRALSLLGLTRKLKSIYNLNRNISADLSGIAKGQYRAAHLDWSSELVELLNQMNIKTVFIIRDLRDVVVSKMHYIMNYKRPFIVTPLYIYYYRWGFSRRHHLFDYFNSLKDDSERLMELIIGEKAKGIVEATQSYLPWLNEESCCTIRFEYLIGLKGGSSKEQQVTAIEKIASHLGIKLSTSEIDYIARNVFSKKSTTFRRGIVGDWKNNFNEKHKEAFKERAGQLLIDLGYEMGFNW